MEISIMANGKKERHAVKVYSLMRMDRCTKANGQMINIMARALNNGIIMKSSIRVTSSMGKRLARASSNLAETFMKVTLYKANSMGKENTFLSKLVTYMKETLLRTASTEKAR